MKQNIQNYNDIPQDLLHTEMESLLKEYANCESWSLGSWEVEEAMAKLETLCIESCKDPCMECLNQAKNTMGILEKEAWLHHIERIIHTLCEDMNIKK